MALKLNRNLLGSKTNKSIAILLVIFVVVCAGCPRRDAAHAVISTAMKGGQLQSARDIKHHNSGLREQVDELFFYVDPAELKALLPKADFVRDDGVPAQIRSANSDFKQLVGSADQADAIGFRRSDLGTEEGKYCVMLCASDYRWVYLIYVDYGKS